MGELYIVDFHGVAVADLVDEDKIFSNVERERKIFADAPEGELKKRNSLVLLALVDCVAVVDNLSLARKERGEKLNCVCGFVHLDLPGESLLGTRLDKE